MPFSRQSEILQCRCSFKEKNGPAQIILRKDTKKFHIGEWGVAETGLQGARFTKKNQNIFKSFKKCQFFCTNTYAYFLSMYIFSVTNLIFCVLHNKLKNLTQIQQWISVFQSVYLSFLYTSHMNTYVYDNLYTYATSICLHENIFSDFFEMWKRYFCWKRKSRAQWSSACAGTFRPPGLL